MLIVITGLDGSGTSSIAKKLNELDKDSYLFRTPSKEYTERKFMDEIIMKESGVAHLLYYLSSVVFMSDYIKKHCDYKNKNVYMVRYLVDTVVSNRASGFSIDLDYNIYGNQLLEPDLTIFVNLREEERQRRMLMRGKDTLDEKLDDNLLRAKFLREYKKLLDPEKTIYVDNDDDLDKVVMELKKKIDEYINKK